MSNGESNLGVAPNLGGLLAYAPCCIGLIFSIVVAAAEKQSRFLRFHAFQSLLVHAALFVISIGGLVARANAYASLSAAATAFGGPMNLLPSLRLIASLRLPTLPASHLNLLALLAALLGLRANLTALGLNVSASANLTANLRLALQPLLALPPLNLVTPPAYPMALPTLNASFMASANAIASLNLNAALALRLPNLAPLTLMAALTANGGLGRASACGSSCPVGSRL